MKSAAMMLMNLLGRADIAYAFGGKSCASNRMHTRLLQFRDPTVNTLSSRLSIYDDLELASDQIESIPAGEMDIETLEEIPFIVQAWSKQRDATRIERLIKRVVDERISGNNCVATIDPFMYNVAITTWAQAGEMERAEEILFGMLEDGGIVKPNVVSFNSCLNGWARIGNAERAEALLTKMTDLRNSGWTNLNPDDRTYNAILESWAKASRKGHQDAADRAEDLLMRMIANFDEGTTNIVPDAVSYTCVLDALAYSHSDRAAERAQALVDTMFERHKRDANACLPDTICLTALINSWAKSGMNGSAQKAEDVLDLMEALYEEGYEDAMPNLISFNAAMNAWAKSGERNAGAKAEALFHRIRKINKSGKYGMKEPDQITYNSLVEAWSKTRSSAAAEKANQWLLKMDKSCRLGPKAYSYAAVIGAWSRCGKPGAVFKAEQVFDMMRAKYIAGNNFVRPNIDAYNNLIIAWANSGEDDAAENAERILRQMEAECEAGSLFVIPNALTYSSVINAWTRSLNPDAPDRAEAILSILEADYTGSRTLTVNPFSYLAVMNLWAKSNHPDKASKVVNIHDRMKRLHDQGIPQLKPSAQSYTTVINACAFSGFEADEEKKTSILKIATDAFTEIQLSKYASPTDITYGTYIKACYNLSVSRNGELLRKLITEAFKKGKEDGLVSDFVLKQLKVAAPSDLYDELLGIPGESSSSAESRVDYATGETTHHPRIPEDWSRNVEENVRRRPPNRR